MERPTTCAVCGAPISERRMERGANTCSDRCHTKLAGILRRNRRLSADPTYRPRTAPISAGGAPGTRTAAPPPPCAPPVERRPPGLSLSDPHTPDRHAIAGQHVAACLRLGASVVHAYGDGRVLSVFGGEVPDARDDDHREAERQTADLSDRHFAAAARQMEIG